MNRWKEKWEDLWEKAQERSGGRLVMRPKDEMRWFWVLATILLKIVTLGRGSNIYENFYTTMGWTIWLPWDGSPWEKATDFHKFHILSHEIDHIDAIWLGDHRAQDYPDQVYHRKSWFYRILHSVMYLFWPFPFFFAYHRQKIEYWGYQRNLEAHIVKYGEPRRQTVAWIRNHFTGPSYAWMATQKRADVLVQRMIEESMDRYRAGELDHLKESRGSW